MPKNKGRAQYVLFTCPSNLAGWGLPNQFGVGRIVLKHDFYARDFSKALCSTVLRFRLEAMEDWQNMTNYDYWQSVVGKSYIRMRSVPEAVLPNLAFQFISLPEYLRVKAELIAKQHGKLDTKRRRQFVAYNNNTPVAKGVYYRDGNIQVLWRSDIGWTGEQYRCISYVFGIMRNVNRVELED